MIVLALLGCPNPVDPPVEEDTTLTAVTFNAGLAVGFVPGAEERLPAVAEAIGGLDAEIVCLQEVWLPDQVAAIKAATGAFPHQLWPDPRQSSDAICNDGEIDSFVSCMDAQCASDCADEVTDCALATCPIPFVTLPLPCMRCAMANVGTVTEGDVLRENCETDPIEYAYGGSFGTALLSEYPIKNQEELVLESTSNSRSVLRATVEAPSGDIDVFCTHLSAVFATIPYPREEGGWAEEQAVQITELRSFVESKGGDRVLLMGDFNTGPAVGSDVRAEVVENWTALSEGFEAPYVDEVGTCTFCDSNGLTGNAAGDAVLIDNILVKGVDVVGAARVLDEDRKTERCGEELPGALSDHYGVQVDLPL